MNRPEELLQRSIVDLWRVIGRPNVAMQADATGLIGHKRRGVAAGLGVRPGWPDLMFVNPEGHVHFVELKSAKGRLSPHQTHFQTWCKYGSIPHLVCRDVESIRAWWKEHGLSREADR